MTKNQGGKAKQNVATRQRRKKEAMMAPNRRSLSSPEALEKVGITEQKLRSLRPDYLTSVKRAKMFPGIGERLRESFTLSPRQLWHGDAYLTLQSCAFIDPVWWGSASGTGIAVLQWLGEV